MRDYGLRETGYVFKVLFIDLRPKSLTATMRRDEASPVSSGGKKSKQNKVQPLGRGSSEDTSKKGHAVRARPAIRCPWRPRKCKLSLLYNLEKRFHPHGPCLLPPDLSGSSRHTLEKPVLFSEEMPPRHQLKESAFQVILCIPIRLYCLL